jgi:hypothetical protein
MCVWGARVKLNLLFAHAAPAVVTFDRMKLLKFFLLLLLLLLPPKNLCVTLSDESGTRRERETRAPTIYPLPAL